MTITDKLEGLLPADGQYTKDQRVIAEAVRAMRETDLWADFIPASVEPEGKPWLLIALALIIGFALGAVL